MMMNKNKIWMTALMTFPFLIWGQVGGDLKKDGRKMTTDQPFVLNDTHEGSILFEIAVDAKGAITAIKVVDDETSVRSTPAKIKATNYVKKFEFEQGTWFPKHHQGTIRLSLVQKRKGE